VAKLDLGNCESSLSTITKWLLYAERHLAFLFMISAVFKASDRPLCEVPAAYMPGFERFLSSLVRIT
jgi:hypothetical protein